MERTIAKTELSIFYGEPMSCTSFITTVKNNVEGTLLDLRNRLLFLNLHCEGEP